DFNGRIDRVAVRADVAVQTAGNYQFGVTLRATNGAEINASVRVNLSQGAQQVSVSFTAEEISRLGVDGPYTIKDAILTFQDDPGTPVADYRENAGETAAYSLSDLDRGALFFTGQNTATGIDTDGDGKFDILRVESEIFAANSGFYQWTGNLQDRFNTEVDFFSGVAFFTSGTNTVTFDFDGGKIGRNGKNGPYFVSSVLLFGAGRSAIVEELFETRAFLVTEFTDAVPEVPADAVAPVTAASLSTPPNAAGWHRGDVAVTLAAADNAGGTGVRSITYSATGAQSIAVTTVGGAAVALDITAEGTTTVSFYAADEAGNVEAAKTVTVSIDRTAPTISVSRTPDANAFGWNNTDVTADYAAGDALSGLASPATGSHAFTAEGAGQSHTFTVEDRAGNTASATVGGVNIDKTAPAVTITSPAAAGYGLERAVAAGYECGDELSGLDGCAGPVTSGGLIDTDTLGIRTFTVSARDRAGNASTRTVSYTVFNDAYVLVIDADAIGKGQAPNNFTDGDVNLDIAGLGARRPLRYFSANLGGVITLRAGQVGDEGVFALKSIPSSWAAAGPTTDGLRNYIQAGPGLGAPDRNGDRESLLDKVPDVTPLRATGLKLLAGERVFAVVYDGDVGVNYGPLNGSLKGKTLGVVAFEVVEVTRSAGASSSTLPQVKVRILDAAKFREGLSRLLRQAPAPRSSSEPMDVAP
ncbi:MAG: hypothetical protein ACRD68_05835, partial [Pyrinomonadaceae bacterium]